jgi:hypothetical protein
VTKPAADHHHREARSLTGGRVYHGEKLPELRGAYIYGDFSTGRVWGIKHDGERVTWQQELCDTPFSITGFGLDPRGELIVIDHAGQFYYLEPTPPVTTPNTFPRKLSETGLFLSVRDHVVDPALVPYSVNAPLWSDGAHKERFIALPGTSQIDFNTSRGWNFPEGAVLVKTFALDMVAGDPSSRRRIETRLMTKQQKEWVGYTYLWNEEQTEAELVESQGADREFLLKEADGSERKLAWHYPSRAECMVCHSRAANFVLGLTEMQMNKVHDYGNVRDHQFRTLSHLGLLRVNTLEHEPVVRERWKLAQSIAFNPAERMLNSLAKVHPLASAAVKTQQRHATQLTPPAYRAALIELAAGWNKAKPLLQQQMPTVSVLPRTPVEYRKLVDPYDDKQPLEARARSYLHSNCATCHVEAGGGNALMELEVHITREKMRIFDVVPQHHKFDLPDARLIAPGHPERSVLLHRVQTRGAGQMPPLATNQVDEAAVKMLREWILSLPKAK